MPWQVEVTDAFRVWYETLSDEDESEGTLSSEGVEAERHASQARIAQAASRADLYLAALAAAIESLGGQLTLTAVFPNQSVDLAIPASVEEDRTADLSEAISAVSS